MTMLGYDPSAQGSQARGCLIGDVELGRIDLGGFLKAYRHIIYPPTCMIDLGGFLKAYFRACPHATWQGTHDTCPHATWQGVGTGGSTPRRSHHIVWGAARKVDMHTVPHAPML